jgi:pyruvate-ferredoxin/flavodoxin oxidoreductase
MDPNTWNMGNPLVGLQPGCTLFQHTPNEDPQQLWNSVPDWAKYYIKENNIQFYSVDTIRIAQESCKSDDSLVQRFQGIVLLGVFLRLTPFQKDAGLSEDELFERVRIPIEKYFGRKGADVVNDNVEAARKGFREVFEVPRSIIESTPANVLEKGRQEWEAKGKDTNAFFI